MQLETDKGIGIRTKIASGQGVDTYQQRGAYQISLTPVPRLTNGHPTPHATPPPTPSPFPPPQYLTHAFCGQQRSPLETSPAQTHSVCSSHTGRSADCAAMTIVWSEQKSMEEMQRIREALAEGRPFLSEAQADLIR